MSVSSIHEFIDHGVELISLPDIYIAVKNAIEDPCCNMDELANLINHDPALTAQILKIANCPLYGQVSEINTVQKAITLLGTRSLHDIVLAVSMAESFNSIKNVSYDMTTFWQNSVTRAAYTKSCAIELNMMEPDSFFIIGLLSDIGHMVMSIRAPKLMNRVLIQHEKTGYSLHLFERSSFGFDYGELGAGLLEFWNIPKSIVNSIRYQNSPEIAPSFQAEAAITYCAGRFSAEVSDFPNIVDIETLRQAGIHQFDYQKVRETAGDYINEANLTFPITRLQKAV